MNRRKKEFQTSIKKKVIERSGNKCERCCVDFDDDFKGEFHHIKSIVFGGDNSLGNCSLLCKKCHDLSPNVNDEKDLLIYKYYFLRFSSFKEASLYYNVDNRMELYVAIAKDIAKKHFNE